MDRHFRAVVGEVLWRTRPHGIPHAQMSYKEWISSMNRRNPVLIRVHTRTRR